MVLSAQLIPEDNAVGGEGSGQIDDALVAAATELEGDVFFLPEEAAVHQNINAAQEVVCHLAAGVGAILQQLILQPEAGEAPDILPGIAAADLPQEGQTMEPALVLMALLALGTLLSATVLYASYYQGGRSIYLMRRLPDGGRTLRRQVWTVPLRWMAACIAAAAVLSVLCWAAWRLITPAQTLGHGLFGI